jgi:hypothetical protein
VKDFSQCFASLNHAHKIVIAWNHEMIFDLENPKNSETLRGSLNPGVQVKGVKIWGTTTHNIFNDMRFNRTDAQQKIDYSNIPALI